MILGIGIDIIEIDRIKRSIDQYGDNFLKKIYTRTEIEYAKSKSNKYQHFAARFAAKEAIYKALSSDTVKIYSWHDVEIYNEVNGLPKVNFYGELKDYLNEDKQLKISMSHSENYVTCVAILYNK
ncbi:MAG: holo-acyl-carrier protein synthase [Ignavibacteria bacterium]|nr:MAG: holo-acyl-carrier protein synthase [Ignavibacteria bacterium]KAF0162108.1 MAG: holo-acyl-carrier protein synthase [Ignavibacteria bacterium]